MAKQSAAARRAAEEAEERDYTAYVDKTATQLQLEFTEWVLDKTEVDPAQYKTKEQAFREGVRLSMALRSAHQASPENQESLARRRAAAAAANGGDAEEEEPAPRKTARATAKAAPAPAKKAAKKVARPAPEPEEEEEVVEEPAPARRPAKKATAVRRGGRATVTDEEAPF
jgi:hypothetical protein